MTVAKDWARAMTELLPQEYAEAAARLARVPLVLTTVTLDVPPSINHWWKPFTMHRNGHAVASIKLTEEAEAYTQKAWADLRQQGHMPRPLAARYVDLWLAFDMALYLVSPLSQDTDSAIKPVGDILSRYLGVDDCRVRRACGVACLDPSNPRLEVTIGGYRAWDAGGDGRGPWYVMRSKRVGVSLLTEPVLVTTRRCKAGLLERAPGVGATKGAANMVAYLLPEGIYPRQQGHKEARPQRPSDKPTMFGTTALRARGWTPSLIARFLGRPDRLATNPAYASAAPMRLYAPERVLEAEGRAEYREAHSKAQRRVESAREAASRKAEKLVERARTMRIRVKRQDDDEVVAAAVEAYNNHAAKRAERAWEHGYGYEDDGNGRLWRPAGANSDAAFLERITVNYIRHNLTTYDAHLERVVGKAGVRQAVNIIQERVAGAIGDTYPQYREECQRQLERKRATWGAA